MRAALPSNELSRLQALHDLRVMEAPPDARYDEIVQLASALCSAPMAAITLIDGDRQWFLAQIGSSVSHVARDSAICAHTILDDQVMVVSDTTADHRFHDNEFMAGSPWIRFYAGAS